MATPPKPQNIAVKETTEAETQISTGGGRARKRWFLLLSLAIILVSTALQLQGLKGDAVIDDKRLIADYEGRGCGADPVDCFRNMMFGFYYRPVLSASIAIGQKFHDNRPLWFHIENLILHAIVVALAIRLFCLLFRRRATALAAGLLFGLHPIQVCITTFVGGRTDTMVLGFIILFAIGVRTAGRRLRILHRASGRSAGNIIKLSLWIAVSLTAMLGAAFTKEQVIPLVLLAPLLALPLRPHRRSISIPKRKKAAKARKQRPKRLPYWTAIYALPVGIFVLAANSALHDIDFVPADWPVSLHIEMVGRTLWSYTRIYFLPTVDTLHMTTLGAWDAPRYGAALMGYLAAVVWLALLAANLRNRARLILMLWASLGLIACLNIIPIPTQFASPYRAGISLFGFAGLVGSFLVPDRFGIKRSLAQRREDAKKDAIRVTGNRYIPPTHVRMAILASISLWFAVVTMKDVPNWFDEYALMKAEVAADPNFVCARAALGSMEMQKGNYAAANRLFESCISQLFGLSVSREQYPEMIRSSSMMRTMRSASTLRYRAVQYVPAVVREQGRSLLALHRPAEAEPYLRAVLRTTPGDTVARDALTACYHDLHQDGRADAVHRMEDVLLGHPL